MLAVVLLTVALATLIVYYFKWSYQYWQLKNVPCLPPVAPFGNFTNPLNRSRENIGVSMQHYYEKIKGKNWKHAGIYFVTKPFYFPIDLDLIKSILTKDFHHFTDRGTYYDEASDPLAAHLFAIGGPKWRRLRTKITPTFTSGKMKMMFNTLLECEASLRELMAEKTLEGQAIDIKEVLGCFTTDVIGSCAFGLDCQTIKEMDSPFRFYGKKIFTPSKWMVLRRTFVTSFPQVGHWLRLKMIPEDISEFFLRVVKDTIDYRGRNKVSRKDFLQLLMDLRDDNDQGLTVEEIAAQCFVFFLAGFETSSTAMTFALYELAKNPDIQTKVRQEIRSVLAENNGEITYEAVQEMKYLSQVVDETLRKYPPLPVLTRQCVKAYQLPDGGAPLEPGIRVIISILGIHYDPDYYPDPEKFDPDRFSDEMKRNRVPYTYLPFGEGPRNCIGLRFGLMQSKVGLVSLLQHYEFTVNDRTREPLKMNVKSLVLAADGDIWLNGIKVV